MVSNLSFGPTDSQRRFEISGTVKVRKVEIELTREDRDTQQSSVLRKVQEELPRTKDRYCNSCSTSRYNSRSVTCTCDDNYYHDSEDAIRLMSITHYEELNAGDSVYLKFVSGGAWVGGTSKFTFSGEYIQE